MKILNESNKKSKYFVSIYLDSGNAESGPLPELIHDLVEASSKEEAMKITSEMCKDDPSYCGCDARLATEEEIEEYNEYLEEIKEYD